MSAEIEIHAPGALLPAERDRLAELEGVVERSFVEMGNAFREIRDARLYRETHATFEAYCLERWGIRHQNADRIIRSAAVAGILNPIGFIANEAQARELVPLLGDEASMVEVWRELRAEFGDRLTAHFVRKAVRNRMENDRRLAVFEAASTDRSSIRAPWPELVEGDTRSRLIMSFASEQDRDAFVELTGLPPVEEGASSRLVPLAPERSGVTHRLLNAADVAERLSVPKTWVLDSARSGAMPCVRLGKYVRFEIADVERWLEECKQPGRPTQLRR